MSVQTLLLVGAFLSFLLATFNAKIGTINLVALGLALWVLTLLLR